MIIMVIRIVLVLLDILDYVKSRPVAMGNSSEIEVLAGTSFKNDYVKGRPVAMGVIFQPCLITKRFYHGQTEIVSPRWDAGHSIALASFHSVMTHRQKRKMNNSLDRLPWFVFFCGWLVGRCFSLAVHCSVECSVWLFGFDLILTRCQVAVPASAQADQAAASSDPPIQVPDQAALAAAHAEGTCAPCVFHLVTGGCIKGQTCNLDDVDTDGWTMWNATQVTKASVS